MFWAKLPSITGPSSALKVSPPRIRDTIKVWHATSSQSAKNILEGIDPLFFRPESRFGPGFYTAGNALTATLEVKNAESLVRCSLNLARAKVLDLTDPATAIRWGFSPGASRQVCQAIGEGARRAGYTVIAYPSYAGRGTNYAVFRGFDEVLKVLEARPTNTVVPGP